jgi:hypothetical protein
LHYNSLVDILLHIHVLWCVPFLQIPLELTPHSFVSSLPSKKPFTRRSEEKNEQFLSMQWMKVSPCDSVCESNSSNCDSEVPSLKGVSLFKSFVL